MSRYLISGFLNLKEILKVFLKKNLINCFKGSSSLEKYIKKKKSSDYKESSNYFKLFYFE